VDTTLHIRKPTPDIKQSGEDKKKDDEVPSPRRDSPDTVWQLVSIILAAVSAIVTSFALGPAMFIPGIITILIGMLLCISVVILSRKGPASSSYVLARLYAMKKKTVMK
jgi:hypothetical protein